MTTDIDALVERLDWSKIYDGDTMVATGDELTWLIAQLAEWPTRVDERYTTSIMFLMGSAARTLLAMRNEAQGISLNASISEGSEPISPPEEISALTRLSEENARLREALEIISRSGFPAIGKIARAALQGDA